MPKIPLSGFLKAIFRLAWATAGQLLTAETKCFRLNIKYSIHAVALFKIQLARLSRSVFSKALSSVSINRNNPIYDSFSGSVNNFSLLG